MRRLRQAQAILCSSAKNDVAMSAVGHDCVSSCCCYFAVQLAAECARGLSGVGACELTLVREQWSGGS
eukprot:scaffold283083_cov18-Tisochrysis_lutea.AAC.2